MSQEFSAILDLISATGQGAFTAFCIFLGYKVLVTIIVCSMIGGIAWLGTRIFIANLFVYEVARACGMWAPLSRSERNRILYWIERGKACKCGETT